MGLHGPESAELPEDATPGRVNEQRAVRAKSDQYDRPSCNLAHLTRCPRNAEGAAGRDSGSLNFADQLTSGGAKPR